MGLISNSTTIFDAGSLDSGVSKGALTFIKKISITSSTASVSFVHGSSSVVFDGTYKEYFLTVNNFHHDQTGTELEFQCSTNSGSSYGVTNTNTGIEAYHNQADTATALGYGTFYDFIQSTDYINFGATTGGSGSEDDECTSGWLRIFDPANTTYQKHWQLESSTITHSENCVRLQCSGYFNTTSAVNAINFKCNSGNIIHGDFCLYGIN